MMIEVKYAGELSDVKRPAVTRVNFCAVKMVLMRFFLLHNALILVHIVDGV